MFDILQMFVVAFAIGLTGALAPGPTLVATINASVTGGWTAGPKVTIGHMLIELILVLVIVTGLATAALQYTTAIAVIGGAALIVFGVFTISGSRTASLSGIKNSAATVTTNPYLAGFFTSIANPYFWIWWLTVGSALVLTGLAGGIILAGVFMAGHWCADLGWYTVVSTGMSKGKIFLSDTTYRWIMITCGAFLIIFGTWYIVRVFTP